SPREPVRICFPVEPNRLWLRRHRNHNPQTTVSHSLTIVCGSGRVRSITVFGRTFRRSPSICIPFPGGVHMMNRNYRRFLVAGVSLGALSALPVAAAVTSTVNCDPGTQNGCDQTASSDEVDLTLVISGAGDTFAYGVTDTADGAAVAN